MAVSRLQRARNDLMECYEEIRTEFAFLDDVTLARFLGYYDSEKLRGRIRKRGDGYTIRSVPRKIVSLLRSDVLVLIAMNSPKLDENSVFNPFKQLTTIKYWKDDKSIRSSIKLDDGTRLKLKFMVWEQKYSIHGICDHHGLSNFRLIVKERPKLRTLLEKEQHVSRRFLLTMKKRMLDNGNRIVLVTNHQKAKSSFKSPIAEFLKDSRVACVRTKVFGKNAQFMEKIREKL